MSCDDWQGGGEYNTWYRVVGSRCQQGDNSETNKKAGEVPDTRSSRDKHIPQGKCKFRYFGFLPRSVHGTKNKLIYISAHTIAIYVRIHTRTTVVVVVGWVLELNLHTVLVQQKRMKFKIILDQTTGDKQIQDRIIES